MQSQAINFASGAAQLVTSLCWVHSPAVALNNKPQEVQEQAQTVKKHKADQTEQVSDQAAGLWQVLAELAQHKEAPWHLNVQEKGKFSALIDAASNTVKALKSEQVVLRSPVSALLFPLASAAKHQDEEVAHRVFQYLTTSKSPFTLHYSWVPEGLLLIIDPERQSEIVVTLQSLLCYDTKDQRAQEIKQADPHHQHAGDNAVQANSSGFLPLLPGRWWWEKCASSLLATASSQEHNSAQDPLYVYSLDEVERSIHHLKSMKSVDRLFYAMKANSYPEILKLIYAGGVGFECVSKEEVG